MCQVWPLPPTDGLADGDADGLVEGEAEGDSEGLGEGEVLGLGCDPVPLGTCWTVAPPKLLDGTETVTGLVEVPPSVKPRTGGGLLGSRRAQFCPDPSKVTSQR